MFVNIGHYCMILLLFNNILILITPLIKNKFIPLNKINIIKFVSLQQIISTVILISLIYSYIISDFDLKTIKENTHITLPLIYKITALWGNHEGSIFLWCFLLILYMFIIILVSHDLSIKHLYLYTYIMSIISFFFIIFTLFTSNPFLYLYIYHINGSELNPILQDMVLAIHPPLIYLGYIGTSVCYTIVIILLFEKRLFMVLKKYLHMNILVTWCFLTTGIILGSWWSYYELGWGGYWFWDPVENAALLPWLLLVILIHTVKQESLINWTTLLSIFSFIFSLLGTFFVRSGIIVSVHSFIVDYNRGILIFCFIFIIFICSLFYFFLNMKYIYKHIYFTYIDNYINLNNIIILVIFITILIGTILPTIYLFLFNINISIGISFYNYILTPILIPFFLLMFLSVSYKNYNFTIGFLLPIYLLIFIYKLDISYIYLLIITLLLLLFISLIMHIYKYKLINSMILSHFGVFIFFIGVFVSNILYIDHIQIMFPGNEVILQNNIFNLRSINYIIGSNYYSLYGNISLTNKNDFINILFPEKRYYFIKGTYITKSIIYSNYFTDIYTIIGDGNYLNGWYFKFYYRPLMSFIWIGPLFFILSGLLIVYKIFQFKYNRFIYCF